MAKFISAYSANYFHLNAKPRKLQTGHEKCKWRQEEREGQSKYTHAIWLRIRSVGPALSRSGVIVWLKYFMCIGFALPAQTNRLICILSMKTKAETIATAGHRRTGERGNEGPLLKYWQNVLIKQKTDKYWHLCAVCRQVWGVRWQRICIGKCVFGFRFGRFPFGLWLSSGPANINAILA